MRRPILYGIFCLAAGFPLGILLSTSNLSKRSAGPAATSPVQAVLPAPKSSPKTPGAPDISKFTPSGMKVSDEFNLLVPITSPGELGIAINVRDNDNFHLVQFGREVRLTKVENGVPVDLAAEPVPAELPQAFDLIIKRRSRGIGVVVDGTVVAEVCEGTLHRGTVMFAGPAPAGVKVQSVGDIYFADDFMKGAETGSQWEELSGAWRVNTLENSSLSSNAFFYTGRAENTPALSTAGYWFWDNYSFEASCKSDGSEEIGLCFYFRDPKNYFLFTWNAAFAGSKGRKQLVKVVDGEKKVLAEAAGGYVVGQWYTMQVVVGGSMAKCLIDGNEVLSARDDGLGCGKIGVYTECRSAARFDDVFVRSDRSVFGPFTPNYVRSWEQLGGKWTVSPKARHLEVKTDLGAKAVTGEDDWRNYRISAVVGAFEKGKVGLAARYRDEANHYLYVAGSDGTHRLIEFSNGIPTVLGEAIVALEPGRPHELFLSAADDILSAGVDGKLLFEEWDETIRTGRAGLYAAQVGTAVFDRVQIDMKYPGEPVLTTNEVFEREITMQSWASTLSDWLPRSERVVNAAYNTNWHRADFPGDVEMSVKLEHLPAPGSSIRLAICADSQKLDAGYGAAISNLDGLAVELLRYGQSLGRVDVPAGEPMRISIQRRGSHVAALVNFKPVLKLKDPMPLKGVIAGFGASGVDVPKDHLEVTCPAVQVYTFDTASSDWRVASGTWQVANRWQCDPRWSFFSGESRGDAILWCKRLMKKDVTLEFAAGIKMDRARGGRYEYASDINATICADGRDLVTGYSFMFGGWQNTSTRILRGATIVAESRNVIPNQQDIHRRWFYIKIRKIGGRLEYYVDNQLLLEYEDPDPLQGDRLAIWTRNNGIMMAKVRMSCCSFADTLAPGREHPDFKISDLPKSPYTALGDAVPPK